MSQLEKLVHEIGFEVEKLTSKINDEKDQITGFEQRINDILKETDNRKKINNQLKEDILKLEKSAFREIRQTTNVTKTNELLAQRCDTLNKTIGEITNVANSLRTEREQFIFQYRSKLESYEDALNKNLLLRKFLETWKLKLSQNEQLVELPDIILELSKSMANYTQWPLQETLNSVLQNDMDENDFDNNCENINTLPTVTNSLVLNSNENAPCNITMENTDLDMQGDNSAETVVNQFSVDEGNDFENFKSAKNDIRKTDLMNNNFFDDKSRLSSFCFGNLGQSDGIHSGDTLMEIHQIQEIGSNNTTEELDKTSY